MNKEIIERFTDACINDHDAARSLLLANPDLRSARTVDGEPLLHYFASEGYIDSVRLLLSLGFDVNVRDSAGDAPLIAAIKTGYGEMVDLLLEAGADPNADSPASVSPILCAVRHGHDTILTELLTWGARPDHTESARKTLVHALLNERTRRGDGVLTALAAYGWELRVVKVKS